MSGWSALTWDDLEQWAGSRTVTRGRAYQRGGHVRDLRISDDGRLLATVQGTERYSTTASRRGATLASSCTCPVGESCKHAVAVIAQYLDAVAKEQPVPRANADDPRWAALDDAQDEDAPPTRNRTPAATTAWDDKIERHLRAQSQEELATLVWSLARRFPDIYQEFRDRLALQDGDVRRIVAEARREIRRVTSESAWRDGWSGDGHTPDYSGIRHRFERLLELGHADEVVTLGREFIRQGMEQIGGADDEGETATAFIEPLPVIFQAVVQSNLSGPDRLLFAIDAVLTDEYDLIGDAAAVVFDAPSTPADWSAVAQSLTRRLSTTDDSVGAAADRFMRDYRRDRLTNWIARALDRAGRGPEQEALYEAEARATGSYQRHVEYLLERERYDDAERWSREGIAATAVEYPGIAVALAGRLRQIATIRKRWDVVAAHVAHDFFDRPSPAAFAELIEVARKARVATPVRAAALAFLETGRRPYQLADTLAPPRTRTGRPSAVRSSSRSSRELAAPPLTIDPAWPLPVPDYLVPLLDRRRSLDAETRPHFGVLLEMAIAADKPDDVLHWFDQMSAQPRRLGGESQALAYTDRVAKAVSATYPQRVIDIYKAGLDAQLPHAGQSAYEAVVGYLGKLRPLYTARGRTDDWAALLAAIRGQYRNRPRLMELLDGLEGRTIVQSARKPRK